MEMSGGAGDAAPIDGGVRGGLVAGVAGRRRSGLKCHVHSLLVVGEKLGVVFVAGKVWEGLFVAKEVGGGSESRPHPPSLGTVVYLPAPSSHAMLIA